MNPVTHAIQHSQMGIPEAHAVVDAWPSAHQIYTSPIAGEPDTSASQSIAEINHVVTGFLMPKPGVLTEIHMVAQGNTGTGVSRNVRWSVATVNRNTSASSGLGINSVLGTGVTGVADNAAGDVTLASGLSLNVPTQFVIAVKAAYRATDSEKIKVQLMRGGGPIPGVVGYFTAGSLIPAATYQVHLDSSNPTPTQIVPGEPINISVFKGIALYIKWRGE